MKRLAQTGILAALFCAAAFADPVILSISGNPLVSGTAGSTVGWGFQIVNNTSFYLFVDNSAFCGPGGDPQFDSCTSPYDGVTNFGPALGTYTDFIANNLTVILPMSTATQAFAAGPQTGIGEYAISPSAIPGSTDPADPATQTSNIFISFQEYDGDPFGGGTQQSGDIEISTPVEVQVLATPEPEAWLLMASAFLMLGVWLAARSRLSGRPVRSNLFRLASATIHS